MYNISKSMNASTKAIAGITPGQRLQSELENQLAYWKQQLKGVPPLLQLPIDHPRKQVQTFNSATRALVLPQPLSEELKALSQQEGVTLFALLLAAFKTLLYRYTEQDDILVGTPLANTLIVRTNLSGNPSFQQLLSRVHSVTLEAYAHQDLPFEHLVEELQLEWNMSHAPLVQVMFHLNDAPNPAAEIQSLKVDNIQVVGGTAQFDLTLEIVEKAEGLSCLFSYNTDLFDATTIERMLGHYRTLLEGIVTNPEQPLLTLPLTDVEEAVLSQHAAVVVHAPGDLLEHQLKEIWQEVLDIKPIGIKNNFFDLGGDSLLAVQLFAEINKKFGKNLSMTTLFQASTIEQLANLLRQEECSAPSRSLVAIQPNGSQPPLFCIHPVGGTVLLYQQLARYLPEQPLYGLQAQGLDGSQTPFTKIVDMAAHYIKELQTIQPEGPYFLGGYSFGGLVAFEMAQQLQTQGQKVALLALFDTQVQGYLKRSLLPWFFYHLNKLLEFGPNYILGREQAKIQQIEDTAKARTLEIVHELGLDRETAMHDFIRRVVEANLQARQDYVPQVYSGRVDLFRAMYEPTPEGWHFDRQLGWGRLAITGVKIHEIPSAHHCLFSEPQIQVIAEKLQVCLDQLHIDV